MESASPLPLAGPSTPQRNSRLSLMRQGLQHLFTGPPNVPQASADADAEAPKSPAAAFEYARFSAYAPDNDDELGPGDSASASASPPSPVSPQSDDFPHEFRIDYIPPLHLRANREPLAGIPSRIAFANLHSYANTGRRAPGYDIRMGTWEDQDDPSLPVNELHPLPPLRRTPKPKPPHRPCFPALARKVVRNKILVCLLSGGVLVILLTLYLGMAISQTGRPQLFHVIFILIILAVTIVFCHALIRVCMLALADPAEARRQQARRDGRFVLPKGPIRVTTVQDDIESAAAKLPPPPPPAYGLTRCSVRANPDLFYWQRNEDAPPVSEPESIATTQAGVPVNGYYAPRPPSYMSDDGVEYALDPLPRPTRTPSVY
ncbi:MAG: hypothetical protein M1829_002765 [Trizodia sp. TS-e1964]|nr:MAG: hypothetical protein M1829_002765 [Trizodia sp. TS-e1964]